MKSKLTSIISLLLVSALICFGVFHLSQSRDTVHLGQREDPADDSGSIYQVWEVIHPIEKEQVVTLKDLKIAERRQFDVPPGAVRVWLKEIDWYALTDLKEGQILLEENLEPEDPEKLKAYLKKNPVH